MGNDSENRRRHVVVRRGESDIRNQPDMQNRQERSGARIIHVETQCQLLRTNNGFKANVTGLVVRLQVSGREVTGTNAETVDLIRVDNVLKIGIPKSRFDTTKATDWEKWAAPAAAGTEPGLAK